MAAQDTAAQLEAEAAWWRAEQERLGRELARMSAAHAEAIGPVAVQRMQVDHETALHLARDCEIRAGALGPDVGGSEQSDQSTLF
ncbi:hypothetical protein ABFU82_22675 [Nocardioides sp. WV_118_6]